MVKEIVGIPIKDAQGYTLSEKYGFVLEEVKGRPLVFDYIKHPEYRGVLLINQEVFFLKFWKSEDILKLQAIINDAAIEELAARNESTSNS